MTSLEIAIIKAARDWDWARKSCNIYRDKQSRLRLKQAERSLEEACDAYTEEVFKELARLGQEAGEY